MRLSRIFSEFAQLVKENPGSSIEDFLARSRTRMPGGKPYANLCIGCDAFHEEMLGTVIDRATAVALPVPQRNKRGP